MNIMSNNRLEFLYLEILPRTRVQAPQSLGLLNLFVHLYHWNHIMIRIYED